MNNREKGGEEETAVQVAVGEVILEGDLTLPDPVQGLILFAHGSGSSRHSPRNRAVARFLRSAGQGTLLFDLLTAAEENEDRIRGHLRFDIPFLAERLVTVTDWLPNVQVARKLPLGYFGASTGAAAALLAAAARPDIVRAIVSRGGRPDLADPVLTRVKAPTLLIVGGHDYEVIRMNQEALEKLSVEKKLVIVPGATHLFEEPGTLEQVAQLAAGWFQQHLSGNLKNRKP